MKKKLLSIALMGFAFAASSQTTIFKEDFNSYAAGSNLSSDFTGATPGQGGWRTETLSFGENAATKIVSIAPNDNVLQITGYDGPSTTSPTPSASRTVFRSLSSEWASRPTDQNTFSLEFKLLLPALSSSKNAFSTYLLDDQGNRLLGVNINAQTRKAVAFAYVEFPASGANPAFNDIALLENLKYNGPSSAKTPLIFSDAEQLVNVVLVYNNVSGEYFILVEGVSDNGFYYAPDNNALVGVNPDELNLFVSAGTSNTTSEIFNVDDFTIKSQSCVFANNSEFNYSAVSACIGSANLTPTKADANTVGTFSAAPAGLSIDATTGVINMTNSLAGTYMVKYTTNEDVDNGLCPDFHTEQIVIKTNVTPAFSSVSVCSGLVPSIPTTSTNSITGAWSPSFAAITAEKDYTFTADANQCVTSPTVILKVTIASPVTPTFAIPTAICSGTVPSLPLTSTNVSPITGTWSPTFAAITADQQYVFTATTVGCYTTAQVTIPVTANVTPSFAIPVAICSGTVASLPLTSTNVSPITGTWSPTFVAITAPTDYTFTAKTAGCFTSPKVTVPVNALPTATITATGNTSFCTGGSVQLASSIGVSYEWKKDATVLSTTTQSYSPNSAGSYTVKVTDGNGCSKVSDAKVIAVLNCAGIEEAIISPFTIYPNPSNDVISVSFSELTSKNGTINFISADGKLIESRDYNNSSVETFDVKSLNPGVYFLQIDNSIEKVIVQ